MTAPAAAQPLLDPKVLGGLAHLELVARTVVEGLLSGLHRSLRPGFSVEFADYRAYEPGDDPRFIDWNAYARTDRLVLKRYQGETTTHLMIALDASASMGTRSTGVSKLEYARFLAAALGYIALGQHDPVGWIVFDEKLREYRPPGSRRGQLRALCHALERTEPGSGTDVASGLEPFARRVNRRGLVALISDFFCEPEAMLRGVRPLAARGQELMLFHVLDPADRAPSLQDGALLVDAESGRELEVSAEFAQREYPQRIAAHIERVARAARELRADHVLIETSQPLDAALRAYLSIRRRKG